MLYPLCVDRSYTYPSRLIKVIEEVEPFIPEDLRVLKNKTMDLNDSVAAIQSEELSFPRDLLEEMIEEDQKTFLRSDLDTEHRRNGLIVFPIPFYAQETEVKESSSTSTSKDQEKMKEDDPLHFGMLYVSGHETKELRFSVLQLSSMTSSSSSSSSSSPNVRVPHVLYSTTLFCSLTPILELALSSAFGPHLQVSSSHRQGALLTFRTEASVVFCVLEVHHREFHLELIDELLLETTCLAASPYSLNEVLLNHGPQVLLCQLKGYSCCITPIPWPSSSSSSSLPSSSVSVVWHGLSPRYAYVAFDNDVFCVDVRFPKTTPPTLLWTCHERIWALQVHGSLLLVISLHHVYFFNGATTRHPRPPYISLAHHLSRSGPVLGLGFDDDGFFFLANTRTAQIHVCACTRRPFGGEDPDEGERGGGVGVDFPTSRSSPPRSSSSSSFAHLRFPNATVFAFPSYEPSLVGPSDEKEETFLQSHASLVYPRCPALIGLQGTVVVKKRDPPWTPSSSSSSDRSHLVFQLYSDGSVLLQWALPSYTSTLPPLDTTYFPYTYPASSTDLNEPVHPRPTLLTSPCVHPSSSSSIPVRKEGLGVSCPSLSGSIHESDDETMPLSPSRARFYFGESPPVHEDPPTTSKDPTGPMDLCLRSSLACSRPTRRETILPRDGWTVSEGSSKITSTLESLQALAHAWPVVQVAPTPTPTPTPSSSSSMSTSMSTSPGWMNLTRRTPTTQVPFSTPSPLSLVPRPRPLTTTTTTTTPSTTTLTPRSQEPSSSPPSFLSSSWSSSLASWFPMGWKGSKLSNGSTQSMNEERERGGGRGSKRRREEGF
ncbi:hypothetical protein HMI55_001979 [Coelomomyces lativittatus]|nr:hypothetical protein HMI55_001979 [Coelomomyces lativittatus]